MKKIKYVYSISMLDKRHANRLKGILPENFYFGEDYFKKGDGKEYLYVETEKHFLEEEVLDQVLREVDRISFFVNYPLSIDFLGKEENGTIKRSGSKLIVDFIKGIPSNIDKQHWTSELEQQLYLWRIALSKTISYCSKINLLYQIIEIAHPSKDYPSYIKGDVSKYYIEQLGLGWIAFSDEMIKNHWAKKKKKCETAVIVTVDLNQSRDQMSKFFGDDFSKIFPILHQAVNLSSSPHPLREAKLLRDLVSHGKFRWVDDQMENYCNFLKIHCSAHTPTDRIVVNKINKRIPIIEKVAKEIIKKAISYKNV